MNMNERAMPESAETPDSYFKRTEVQQNSREAEQIPQHLSETGAVAPGKLAGAPKRPLRPYTDATDEQLNALAALAIRQTLAEALSYQEYEEDKHGEYAATAPTKDGIPSRKRYTKLPEDLTELQCRTILREFGKQGLTNKFDLKIDEIDVQRRQGSAPEIIADQEAEPIDPDDLEAWMKS